MKENGYGRTAETHGQDCNTDELTHKLERAGIFKRYQSVTFEQIERQGLPDNRAIKANYSVIKQYAADMDSHVKNGEGLILAGTYGTLKTTMAIALLRQWIDGDHGGLLIPMCSIIDNLQTMRAMSREEEARFEHRLRNTPLLVIDDLGAENTDTGWVKAKVDSIITERYNKMLAVIITTNLQPQELTGTYGGRVIDRLKQTNSYLSFFGQSERKTQAG